MDATASEVLFGGAAGGGKSYAQVIDALIYALTYRGSRQLILRRTLPELNKSIIRTHLELYPKDLYKYSSTNHTGTFFNGSIIDFGYCDSENDVYKYQSAEYDVIRFDELTHFTRQMYIYLLSRLRGANSYPKQVKSSANPGGVGHSWVKERFIDIGPPGKVYNLAQGCRLFIPSKVTDNSFLLKADPDYIKRLQNLDEKDRKALLYGDWDIFEGQYFTEFDRSIYKRKDDNMNLQNFLGVNLKIRFKNPYFWLQLTTAFIMPILTYFGAVWQDMTSWPALGNLLWEAVKNPVVVVAVLFSLWNVVTDPTTKGFTDSDDVLKGEI